MEAVNKAAAGKKRRSIREARECRTAYICLIPSFIGLAFITYIPLASVFGISFFKWTGLSQPTFYGFRNYIELFKEDPFFWASLSVTLYYSILSVCGSMIYSLFIAVLLNRKVPARGFWRAVFYLPYILPAIAVYVGWSWLYESNFGLFNYILTELGFNKILFLNDSKWVIPALAIIAV